jgi:hypothetical protein
MLTYADLPIHNTRHKRQVHLQVCVEAINRTGGTYCLLVVALVQVIREKNTPAPPCSVCQTALRGRPVSDYMLSDGC